MKPLKGVTILDISRLLPGGYASLLLAERGARVIKIEQPGVGDYYRAVGQERASGFAGASGHGGPGGARSVPLLGDQVEVINAGKESLGLDLKAVEGRRIFKKLVRSADVVLESFRPGVLAKWGLGFGILKKIRRSIILCSITGFGQKGRRATLAAHDLNFLGLSGLLSRLRDAGGTPVIPDFQVADLAAGYEAALAVTAALADRKRKKAVHLDVTMEGAARSMSRLYSGPTPLAGEWARYGVYETSDGGRVTLGALEPKFWSRFCESIGRDESVSRAELEGVFRSRPLAEWKALGEREDICLFPVETPLAPSGRRFPALGKHTVSILRKLRYTSKQIGELRRRGIIE